ncbi:MAG: hypothetical protein LBJ64_13545 [Deltaproteobacteria bacterium]|nr:hypothetical protein [Deltaproteobacteria bacterium]
MIVDDALTLRVTKEILKILQNGQISGSISGPVSVADKPKLLVAGPLDVLSEGCRAWLAENYDLTPISGLNVGAWPKAPLLTTSLSLQALVQVASGDEGCTTEGRALLSALLEGRPAVALAEGTASRRLPPTAPRVFVSMYQTSETILQNAGLVIAAEKDLPAALKGPNPALKAVGTPFPAPSCGYSGGSPTSACGSLPKGEMGGLPRNQIRVFTEAVVASLFPTEGQGSLRLNKGDILTPLAKDYLSSKKIPVIKEQS